MKRILLIDDDVLVRSLLAEGLAYYNLQIIQANHGKEALDILSEYQVDAIILDIAMPYMDGFDFARETLKLYPHVPILVHSALSNKENVVRMYHCGVRAFFAKPVRISEIYAKLININRGDYNLKPLSGNIDDQFKFYGL